MHPIEQAPPAQDGLPLLLLHTVPHVPQLPTLVFVLVSHPLLGLPSQLWNPELHVGLQAPPEHVVMPLGLVQAIPQAPQFETVLSAASQPLPLIRSQSPKLGLHEAMTQEPVWQAGVAFGKLQT